MNLIRCKGSVISGQRQKCYKHDWWNRFYWLTGHVAPQACVAVLSRTMICALFIYSLSIRHGSIHLILTYFWNICRDREVKIANIGNVWKSRMFSILSLHSWDSQAVSFDGFSHAASHLVLSWWWWWLPSNKSISFKCSVHVEMWWLHSLSHFILINRFSEPSWAKLWNETSPVRTKTY